jgi:undecaprenyl-diphosphatase
MSVVADFRVPAPRAVSALLRQTVINLLRWTWSMVSFRRIRPDQRWPLTARPALLLLIAGGAVASIALTMLVLDGRVIAAQRTFAPWLVTTFGLITDAGQSGWVLTPLFVAIVAAALISSPTIGRVGQLVTAAVVARLGYVFMAVVVPGVVVTIVKRIIGRARPYLFEQGGPLRFHPFGWDPIYASLPSGHTTTAFATAFAVGALYPRLRWPVWGLACVIGASRIVVSAHYPSDVLAAALVGTLGAVVVRNWFAVRRLAFHVTPDRRVEALPGPSLARVVKLVRRPFA